MLQQSGKRKLERRSWVSWKAKFSLVNEASSSNSQASGITAEPPEQRDPFSIPYLSSSKAIIKVGLVKVRT